MTESGRDRNETQAPTAESEAPRGSATRGSAARVEACAELPLVRRVEAILFAADRPLTDARVLELIGIDGKPSVIADAVATLNGEYESTGRAFRIELMAGGRRVLTLPEFGLLIERLRGEREQARLSQAALETLAVIAYRQPVLRAELEAIRGVSCGEVLKTLIERRLVRVTGRAEIVGRPLLYGTTREFLQVFGLASLDDLPKVAASERASERTPERTNPQP